MVVDVATTSRSTSDQTAVAVLGVDPSGRRLVVEQCRGIRAQPNEVRDLAHRLAGQYGAKEVHVEVNAGGDTWRSIFSPMPAGVRLVTFHSTNSKKDRIMDLVDLYSRGAVVHPNPIAALERQQLAWPDVVHDDLVDVVALGAQRLSAELVRL